MSEFSVRAARDSDVDAIVALLRTSIGDGVLTSEPYWRWKHLASPFGPSRALLAVDAADVPVGVRVFMRWDWGSDGRPVPAVRAVDTATHPDWRRRGIFRRLTMDLVDSCADEGVAFVFGTPNDQSRSGYLEMGWSDVARVPVRAFVARPLRSAWRAGRARLAGGTALEEEPFVDDGSVTALLCDPRLDDVLATATTDELRFHTVPTRPYLDWRYRQIPGHTYRARWHFNGAEGGIVIARRRARGSLDETSIAQVIATPGPIGRRLARKALLEICGESASDYVVASAAAATPECAALADTLFVPAPSSVGPRFVVRALSDAGARTSERDDTETALPDPFSWASWRCQIGDLELF